MFSITRTMGLGCVVMLLTACGGDGKSRDTTAPETTISGGPAVLTTERSATFSLASSEANSRFETSLDNAPYASATSPITLAGLADGPHTLSVRAIDAAANSDPTPAQFNWTVDGSPPAVRLQFPTPLSYTDASTLHVHGTATDARDITSLKINQAAVTSTDGFRTWSATVQIAEGENEFTVSATDALGNSSASASSFTVSNRGPVTSRIRSLVYDAAHDQVLVADPGRRAVLALRRSDGFARVISDSNHGSGPAISTLGVLALDAANNRVLYVASGNLFAVDLTSGNRTLVSAPGPSDPGISDALAYDSQTHRAFVTGSNLVFAIDVATGARTVLSGGAVGTGPVLKSSELIAVDTSNTPARLLYVDTVDHSIISIDASTGNRTLISMAGTAGAGTALVAPSNLQIDVANHRALVTDRIGSDPASCRLVAVDLATGDRTELTTSPAFILSQATGLALDPATSRVYVGQQDRSRVVQVDLGTQQLSRFSDADVGTGPNIGWFTAGLVLDARGSAPVLYTLALAGPIVRVDLGTANRAVIVPASATFSPLYGVAADFVADLPQAAGTPLRGLIINEGDNSAVSSLFDLTSGASLAGANVGYPTMAGTQHQGHMAADPDRSRLIAPRRLGGQWRLAAIDRPSGNEHLISSPAQQRGNGPDFAEISAVAVAASSKVVVADKTPAILAVDPDSGDRTLVASNTGAGSGLTLFQADDIDADDANNRVLVVNSSAQAIAAVDLSNGNRTLISGVHPDDGTVRGAGPGITGAFMKIRGDFPAGVAYVYTGTDTLLAVDIVSGDRVIAAR